MINANEIMQGCWVEYEGKYYQIDTISDEFPTLNTTEFGIGVVGWNNINGILITDEILVNAGFVPCSIVENNFNISGMCIWKCNDMFLCDKNGVHIKHLHQLQILYFYLTGKHLNIEL